MNTHFAVAGRSLAFQPSSPRWASLGETPTSRPPDPVETFQPSARSYSGLLDAVQGFEVTQLDTYKKLGEGLSIQVTGSCLTGVPGGLLLLFILPSGSMKVGALGTPEENFFLKTVKDIRQHNQPPAPVGDRSMLVELPDGSHLGVVARINADETENLVFTRSAARGQESFRAHLNSGPDGKYTVTQASLQTEGLSNMITIHNPLAANPSVELKAQDKNDSELALGLMADLILGRTAHLLPGHGFPAS